MIAGRPVATASSSPVQIAHAATRQSIDPVAACDHSAAIRPQNAMPVRPSPQNPYGATSAVLTTPNKSVTAKSGVLSSGLRASYDGTGRAGANRHHSPPVPWRRFLTGQNTAELAGGIAAGCYDAPGANSAVVGWPARPPGRSGRRIPVALGFGDNPKAQGLTLYSGPAQLFGFTPLVTFDGFSQLF